VSVGADRPRPGHLHVSQLAHAAYANRPLLFVIGLEEGRVFPSSFEDAVLLDAERAGISPLLRRSSDKVEEAVYATLSRLAAASANPGIEICLSYSCRDLREFRHTFPSWLMLQAHRGMAGKFERSYDGLQRTLGEPRSCVPDASSRALDEAGVVATRLEADRRAREERGPATVSPVEGRDRRRG